MNSTEYNAYLKLINSSGFIKLHNYYTRETYWEITSTARSELAHSAFLKWLLDVNGSHGLGELPFKKFMQSLCVAKDTLNTSKRTADVSGLFTNPKNLFSSQNSALFDMIKIGAYSLEQGEIKCEHSLGKGRKRADVYIEATVTFQYDESCTFVICIENKVTAKENGPTKANAKYQTEEYEDKLLKREGKKVLICPVFLTPYSNEDMYPKSKEFLAIDYRHLLQYMIEPLINASKQYPSVNSRLVEYRRCLGPQSSSFIPDNGTSPKDAITMAVSDYEIEAVKTLLTEDTLLLMKKLFSSLKPEQHESEISFDEVPFWTKLANLYRFTIVSGENLFDCKGDEKLEKSLEEFISAINKTPKSTSVGSVYIFNIDSNKGTTESYKSRGGGSYKTLNVFAYRMIEKYLADNPGAKLKDIASKVVCESKFPFISKADADSETDFDKLIRLKDYYVGTYPDKDMLDKLFRSRGNDFNANDSLPPLTIEGKEYYVYRWWGEAQIQEMIKRFGFENDVEII